MCIRHADERDVSRVAEILVFNNRINYFPIFNDEGYSFGELQVMSVAEALLLDRNTLESTFVYDDGIVRGFVCVVDGEIKKLYVDSFFQSRGIGKVLVDFAVEVKGARFLWALEKNTRAIAFYRRHGFAETGEKAFEEGTSEYIVRMERAASIL